MSEKKNAGTTEDEILAAEHTWAEGERALGDSRKFQRQALIYLEDWLYLLRNDEPKRRQKYADKGIKKESEGVDETVTAVKSMFGYTEYSQITRGAQATRQLSFYLSSRKGKQHRGDVEHLLDYFDKNGGVSGLATKTKSREAKLAAKETDKHTPKKKSKKPTDPKIQKCRAKFERRLKELEARNDAGRAPFRAVKSGEIIVVLAKVIDRDNAVIVGVPVSGQKGAKELLLATSSFSKPHDLKVVDRGKRDAA